MRQAFLNWSSGKDAAYALYQLQKDDDIEVTRLMTTVNEHFGRVSMHGIRSEVLERQAECLGLPLDIVYLNEKLNLQEYEAIITAQLTKYNDLGIRDSVYGDILLEDLKTFREAQLARLNIRGVFPLWNRNTTELIHEMVDSGLKTIVVCVNEQYLDKSFVGRTIDKQFIEDLPEGVDPCGENGEFHTFVYDGPMFKQPVPFELGEIVYKTYDAPKQCNQKEILHYGFWFLDIL
ncbi:diphthine--ammonia ligase [Myroides marinus]|uniref:Dph6-related ATP pyrophosphatase n=1 Tax=Myroides marinus TaxID=703342 RepID=UPI00257631B5|nr:diphthine--ammonia ligase [Myroides marinus]MDM1348552.1 diphthine--ammonia ligase [Myroides marinus]MDM1352031.1 diphthine--ammonia ligase [Myroides marinus]MDM1355639.1 diphthine--ammonia ligase [Myroides marinus]MDM1359269.1 diphthine--ammonia ligase [Myroides marinus]MDM1360480.1 diphthine--ammonia ligase [Myroides marinus]